MNWTKTGSASRFAGLALCLLTWGAWGSAAGAATYVGDAKCFQTNGCHSQRHTDWSQTKHAGAFYALPAPKRTDPACLACHTVAFGKGGYVNQTQTPGLAGVQCESCHGPGSDHVAAPADAAHFPPKSMAGAVCGQCHTGSHNPTFEEWSDTFHSKVNATVASSFSAGKNLSNCGVCHSGDYRQEAIIEGTSADPNLLFGLTAAQMNGVTCAVCHDPHRRTGNAAYPETGFDYQLRYKEVRNPSPSNKLADTQNAARFNLCGQCHHTRGDVTWKSTTRGPHHSVQANFFNGEMPVPDGTSALVENKPSAMRSAPKQCATCHMHKSPFVSATQPADTGHGLIVKITSCVANGCHSSVAQAQDDMNDIQSKVSEGLDEIYRRLGKPATWEYSAQGGPAESLQPAIPDAIKKVRFLYYYLKNDGSLGVHNPDYADKIIGTARDLLDSVRK